MSPKILAISGIGLAGIPVITYVSLKNKSSSILTTEDLKNRDKKCPMPSNSASEEEIKKWTECRNNT